MAAAAILKNAFLAITHFRLSDFGEIFYAKAERHADKGHMIKTTSFQNPTWRMAAILKIVKSPFLSQKLSDFDEIWYTTSDIEPSYNHVTKN